MYLKGRTQARQKLQVVKAIQMQFNMTTKTPNNWQGRCFIET